VYALGLVDTPEAVAAIIAGSSRFEAERHIVSYALRRSEKAILAMLSVDQPTQVIQTGIQAVRRGGIVAARGVLADLAGTHPDMGLRAKAQEALTELPLPTDARSSNQNQ
jgi:hypothetical protein